MMANHNVLNIDESDLKLIEPSLSFEEILGTNCYNINGIIYHITKIPDGFMIKSVNGNCKILFETLFHWVIPSKEMVIDSIKGHDEIIGNFTWSCTRKRYTNYHFMTPMIILLCSPALVVLGLIGCLFVTRWFPYPAVPLEISLISCAWLCMVCDTDESSDRLSKAYLDN